MKVCYIGHGPYPKNVPTYVHTQLLARLGCEVHVIAGRQPGDQDVEQVGEVLVHRLPESLSNTMFSLKSMSKVTGAIQAILSSLGEIDIVHVRSTAGTSLLPLSMRKSARHWILDVRSPPLHGGLRAVASRFRLQMESIPYDCTFVHANAVAEDIFGKNHPKVVVLPIGVDFGHFQPGMNLPPRASLGIDDDAVVAVYTGSLSSLRQLDRVLEAFALAQHAAGNLHLLMIGEGNDAERLKRLAANLGLDTRVHFTGFVPYCDMPRYLQAADIGLGYVPMTTWYDKAPVLKTMEYLASGLATVATATSGNQYYITNRQNGLLVKDTPGALAAAIVELVRQPEMRAIFRAVARDSVCHYDFFAIVRDILLPTYHRLVGSQKL